ncbi:MAG: histidine kinase [Candidatus Eisenbacteria bacterium]
MRLALGVLALALGFGVLEAMQGRARYQSVPWELFWPEAMIRTLPSWVMLAVLLPVVLWVSERVRIARSTWPLALPLHTAAGVAFVFVHIGLSCALGTVLRHSPEHSLEQAFRSMFAGYAVVGFFTYACLVAAHHAFRAQAEAYEREAASRELQAGLTRAQLQALRSQLDPHFLFNALNSISVMALQGERETVVRLIAGLGDVLRMSLDGDGAPEVPLRAELELLERYLELERVRFGDRLTVERHIEPGLGDALVPSLVLQPLVENAIRHGIAPRRGPGRVLVQVRRAGTQLQLEVRDDGIGFSPERSREGIGLANTRERLRQLYGAAQSMVLGRAPEGGAAVTVSIPHHTLPAGPAANAADRS